MVKRYTKIFLIVFIVSAVGFVFACSQDYLGLLRSTDLSERMAVRDSFPFLDGEKEGGTPRDYRNKTFGTSYKFIVLTDTHIEDGKTFGLEGLGSVIISENIDFVVIAGDITQTGSLQEIQKFIEVADDFDVPVYPVVGNHDFYFDNWPVWKDYIGSTRHRIDFDETSLFILDSANSFFGKEQLDWLENEINSITNADQRVFVFTHSPLFIPFKMQQIIDTKERARITSILRNRCDIMFMGHSHVRVENTIGNVRYVSIEDFVNTKVYCIVTVDGSDVSYEFRKL